VDLRTSLLTVVLPIVLVVASPANGMPPACSSCHPVHFADRGTCIGCHLGNDRTLRKDIAHLDLVPGRLLRYRFPGDPAVERGTQWIDRASCRRCHSIHGTGNRLAGDLDRSAGRNPNKILASILQPVTFMPDFRFLEENAAEVVNALVAGARRDPDRKGEVPSVVRFGDRDERSENVFVKRCGGCHRVLTRRLGGLGKGDAGPNLSGLLSRFYPRTSGEGKAWTVERLRKWLDDPRRARAFARMPPVRMPRKEFTELEKTLRDDE
jgi:cytochrome c2